MRAIRKLFWVSIFTGQGLALISNVHAQTLENAKEQIQSPQLLIQKHANQEQKSKILKQAKVTTRPKIGLALSGGGARGLAHIEVIRALEKLNIPIDYIAGTSAGALVGGIYASGVPIDQLEKEIREMDLSSVVLSQADRRRLKQSRRELGYKSNELVDVGVGKDGVSLPDSVINSTEVENAIRSLLNVQTPVDFDQLPIPFRAVATDLSTGEMVVLDHGMLSQALRASMAIPAVFAPVEIDGRILVDGLVARNLPIDVVREMGADIIIAVDVGEPLTQKDQLRDVLNTSGQLFSIMIRNNVKEQVKTLKGNDVLIAVQDMEVANLEFDRMDEALAASRRVLETPEIQAKLQKISQIESQPQYRPDSPSSPDSSKSPVAKSKKMEREPPPEFNIDYVRIETGGLAYPQALMTQIKAKPGPFSIKAVNRDISELMAQGRFANVQYKILTLPNGKNELVYVVAEKGGSGQSISPGIEVSSRSLSGQQFTWSLSHRKMWINDLGGEWRNYLAIGEQSRFQTEVVQPLSYDSTYFIRPFFGVTYNRYPLVENGEVSTNYKVDRMKVGLNVGQNINQIGSWELGLGARRDHVGSNNANPKYPVASASDANAVASVEVTLDQLNDLDIPTRGYFLNASALVGLSKNKGNRYSQVELLGQYAYEPIPRHSVNIRTRLGAVHGLSSLYLTPFHLGGFQSLSGYEPNSVFGNYLAFTSVGYSYQTGLKLLNKPLIFGTTLEAGNAWQTVDGINGSGTKLAGSLYGAIRSPLGPVQLGVGYNREGDASLYFNLGRTFNIRPF